MVTQRCNSLGPFLKEHALQKGDKLMMDKDVTLVRAIYRRDQHNRISKAIEVRER